MPIQGLATINVDFNWVRRDLLRAFTDEADAPVECGDVVRVVDPGDGTERLGRVEERDADTLGIRLLPEAARLLYGRKSSPADDVRYTMSAQTSEGVGVDVSALAEMVTTVRAALNRILIHGVILGAPEDGLEWRVHVVGSTPQVPAVLCYTGDPIEVQYNVVTSNDVFVPAPTPMESQIGA